MRTPSVAIVIIGMVLGEQGALAQAQTQVVPVVGSIVVPRADLPAQATPPNFFGLSGQPVGVAKSDQPYIVLQRKSYPSLTGDAQNWLQIAPAPNTPPTAGNVTGSWVYYGRAGAPGNLEACTNCAVGEWSGK
jgi:hypothetical protein